MTKELISIHNLSAATANTFAPIIFDKLKSFEGKAYKTDGAKTKAFAEFSKEVLETIELPPLSTVSIICGAYSIRIEFQTRGWNGEKYSDGSSKWATVNRTVFIGEVKGQCIEWKMSPCDFKADFDYEEMKADWLKKKELETAAQAIESKYHYFGQNLYFN